MEVEGDTEWLERGKRRRREEGKDDDTDGFSLPAQMLLVSSSLSLSDLRLFFLSHFRTFSFSHSDFHLLQLRLVLILSRFLSRFLYISLVLPPRQSLLALSSSPPPLSSHFLSHFLLLYGRFFVLYQVAAWNAGVLRPLRAASNR